MVPTKLSGAFDTASLSTRLVLSYALDWIVLIILGLVAFAFTFIQPNFRPFSPTDLSISYPFNTQTVSIGAVAGICAAGPAVVVLIVVVLFVPGPSSTRSLPLRDILRLKIWEGNVALLGLAFAHVTQFLVIQGLKNLCGKPRPNLLARCQPDSANLQKYIVSNYAQDVAQSWVLVDQRICDPGKRAIWIDGFRSFPSGHNSSKCWVRRPSLWPQDLASKFGVGFPLVPHHRRSPAIASTSTNSQHQGGSAEQDIVETSGSSFRQVGYHNQAAAAPIWTVILIYIPMAVAIWIGSTRYSDFYHHGFDVLAGSLVGLLSGYAGFRWYHGPPGQNAGWAWSPRSRDRAFGIGVGTSGYVRSPTESSGDVAVARRQEDLELRNLTAPSTRDANSPPTPQRNVYEADSL